MKISSKSKRTSTPHPQIVELINKLLNTANYDLADVLANIDTWKWPRSDLNAWVKVLDKFDGVLETVIQEYNIDGLQTKEFSVGTKKLLVEILRFERLLLENSTNRKMFNSYDRIKSLFMTCDLDVLILTLNLLLRPAQQYSAQPNVSSALSISTPRLLSLAKKFPFLNDHGLGLVDLTTVRANAVLDATLSESRSVQFSFYRVEETSGPSDAGTTQTEEPVAGSSTKPSSTGAVQIRVEEPVLVSKSPMEILAELVEKHGVPEDEQLELLTRIRLAKALLPGNEVEREKLVIVRLLALAIFGHTHTETQANTSLFAYEPDLTMHISELLRVEHAVPVLVQTAAISALDAFVRYRGKTQEVFTALNAGVNHGILMALVRKTIVDVGEPECTIPHSFVDVLLSFISYVSTSSGGGNMVVGAGLVPLLIQLMENKLPNRLPVVSKTMQLIDSVVYNHTNAFQIFCNSNGVQILVGRIEYEIDLDIEKYGDEERSREVFGSFGQLPVARAAILKHALRSMHRMMQSSGTAEALRGLIDSSLLRSIRKVIIYRGLFGPSVIPLAVNIMATFVHNEPTSLSVVQEAGLPEVFYKAIESGLEPAIEVIQAFANAIGALCLNQTGQEQLRSRPSIIPSIFSIFTSDRHLKVLFDKENALLVGATIDELIRHHPLLKAAVFDSLKATLSKICDLGHCYVIPPEELHFYKLVKPYSTVPATTEDASNTMEDVEAVASTSTTPAPAPAPAVPEVDFSLEDDDPHKGHENQITSYIDVTCRFLEGLFQHPVHCKEFLDVGGLKYLTDLTALPCLPYDFASSMASDPLVQIMRTVTESATLDAISHIANLVQDSLEQTRSFWTEMRETPMYLPYIDLQENELQIANQQFRNLVTLHIRTTLLSDVFATAGYAHSRAAAGLLSTVMEEANAELVKNLGLLHRVCSWENLLLKDVVTEKGYQIVQPYSGPPASSSEPHLPIASLIASGELGTAGVPSDTPESIPPAGGEKRKRDHRDRNAQALRHLLHGLSGAVAPFFQAIVKIFHTRRTAEAAQRKQVASASSTVARIMMQHVEELSVGSTLHRLDYYMVMLSVINIMLVDDRTSAQSLQTVQLFAFTQAGGLESIMKMCQLFIRTIESILETPSESRSEAQRQELQHAYGGVTVALNLLYPIVASGPLFDSAQTSVLETRDKPETDPDYFESHSFLVECRLTTLPILKEIWQAPWLMEAPLNVSKAVVQVVFEVAIGDNEESKADIPAPTPFIRQTATGPDENRIRQLMDMGFPRSAAELALARTHNNVNAATELLLSSPFPLPPDPPAAEANAQPAAAAEDTAPTAPDAGEGSSGNTGDEDVNMGEPSAAEDTTPAPAEPARPARRTMAELKQSLAEIRAPFTAQVASRSLLLVDEHVSLIFDVHYAFVKPLQTEANQPDPSQILVNDIRSFSPTAYDVHEQPMANRCRLLALVLCENPASLNTELRTGLMETLLALMLSNPLNTDAENFNPPKWLAAHLLVVEALLALADEPGTVTLPKEGEPIEFDRANGPTGSAATLFGSSRTIIFDFCLRLLAFPGLPSDETLSILRLLVLLTRDYSIATQFVQRDGVSKLFERMKETPVTGCSSYVPIILRHTAEDPATLKFIMQHSVKHLMSMSLTRARPIEPASFVKNCGALALRDANMFIDVTKAQCQLSPPYGHPQQLSLKKSTSKTDDTSADAQQTSSSMDVDPLQPPTTQANETLEGVVYFLVTELMKSPKGGPEEPAADAPAAEKQTVLTTQSHSNEPGTQTVANPPSSDSGGSERDTPGLNSVQYPVFIMECLTELLFSYDACKSAFLSYSPKKRTQTPSKESASKHRTATLNFFFSELITYGTINPQPGSENRTRMTLCQWAISVAVALCVDSNSVVDSKDVPHELVSIRKSVLEAVSRAIKDRVPSDTLDGRYGRLFALVDLCHRLLTAQSSPTARKPEEAPNHIAKIMLEKNFVPTLTTALSEVDLNYPNVKNLVAAILKPLEQLTKVAIKMSRPSDKNKDVLEGRPESDYSVASDEDDEDDEDDEEDAAEREETPDLYRNSALGMYGGEMDSAPFSAHEDDIEEGDEDEDDDIEMDFGQETGSEHTSDSEEQEADAEMEGEEGSEEWDDEEGDDDEDDDDDEEDDDDLVENEGVAEVIANADEEDEEDDGEESTGDDLWGGIIQAGGETPDDAPEDGEDGPQEVDFAIPMMRGSNPEEPDVMSEDEEFHDISDLAMMGGEPTAQLVQDIFGFGFPDSNRPGGPVLVPRRHRSTDDTHQLFGRRNESTTEAITHPLLLDSRSGPNRPSSNGMRAARVMSRNYNPDAHNLLHAFEDLISTGAQRLFQQIANRSRGATFRLDVPASMMNVDGALSNQRNGFISTQLQIERPNRGTSSHSHGLHFDPMLTLQRWGEENKILHGDFVPERIEKLTNHLILAMLPEAVEAAKQAKIKEEEDRKRKAEQEAERKRKEEEEHQKAEAERQQQAAKEEAEKQASEEQAQGAAGESPQSADATGASTAQPLDTAEQTATLESQAEPSAPAKALNGTDNTRANVPSTAEAQADVVMGDSSDNHDQGESTGDAGSGSNEQPAEAGPSTSASAQALPERITVMIHGSAVDITDYGIDPTFLEALPDDMREEVLNQHIRDQRAARVQRPADSQISTEFLDALPPELRAELIQQERMEQSRRRPEPTSATQGQTGAATHAGPEDMDPASFIASLDPHLRQVVLLDSDDGFIQTLPSHILADAGLAQESTHRHFHDAPRPRRSYAFGAQSARRGRPFVDQLRAASGRQPATPAKPATPHDAIQLLDKPGLAVLIRLLFFPPVLRKNILFKVLLNLCENQKTRTELFNLVLGILQDGSTDLAGVDKSFAQMSFRQSKGQFSKVVGKQKTSTEPASSSDLQTDAVPDLIAQRCLEALNFIVTSNDASSLFFLTEHDLPSGLKRSISRKGKGKEKQAPQTHYPLVLLLGLLDRPYLLKTPSTMESIVGLLATVTRPLNSITAAKEEQAASGSSTDTAVASGEATSSQSTAPLTEGSSAAAPLGAPQPTAEATDAPSADPSVPASTQPEAASVSSAPPKEVVQPSINPEHKILLTHPPQIPSSALRLIVNILTTGECSGRTFQQSLALIQHLSALQDARDTIAQELRAKAQEFGRSLLQDLDELTKALERAQKEVVVNAVTSKFSPASSVQAKLLRVLKTIDYMYSGKGASSSLLSSSTTISPEDSEKVQTIYESFNFNPLWQSLGQCLSVIEDKPDTEHIATVLLPVIEALMVVCKYISSSSPANKRAVVASPMSPTISTSGQSMGDLFVSFTDAHRKILNLMVRNNPSLMSGSFSLLVHNPRVLDFDNKRNYFKQKLHRRPHNREHHSTLQLNVRRARVFEDSYQYLQRKTGEQIKYGKLSVRFYDEEGVDAGGVTREWFQILARQMFDPNNALFQPCAGDRLTYQPNKNSWVNPEHLSFFKFVGRVIGKAIYDGRLLDAYFARSLYRQILGKPVDYRDVEWIDPEYYNSLCWILENDPTPLDLTFSTEADEFGVTRIIPLKENGESITVTEENRREFVQLSAQYRLYSSIKDQIESLLSGFYDVIPKDLITIFNEQELELLISGTPDIDVDEWRAATEYHGYNSSDPVIVWWWRALKSFNRDERAKVLSFATGTAKVPLGGFVDLQGVQGVQRFSIHRAYGEADRLPQAHTCFNQIDLPEYSSYENLRRYLLLAINEGGEGFGFA